MYKNPLTSYLYGLFEEHKKLTPSYRPTSTRFKQTRNRLFVLDLHMSIERNDSLKCRRILTW